MLSFWEKTSLLQTDVAIVGGGLVGLSVAASVKEKFPEKHVSVFERSSLPYGASTRNAGFACFGSLTEVLSDIKTMGEEAARELLFQRWMGLQITRKRLGDQFIGFTEEGGFELTALNKNFTDAMQTVNRLVDDFLPDYVTQNNELKAQLGVKADGDLYRMQGEGQVHTGMLMKSIERYALQLGVVIRTGSEVIAIEGSAVRIKDSFRGEIDFQADQIVVCNNAFAASFFPAVKLKPGRGQVFITKPISNLAFRGNLHLDEGFYYLRNVDDRLLFGGGRNIDFKGEETTNFELNETIQQQLEEHLKNLFGREFQFEVEQRWSGIMAFGEDKIPIVERISDQLCVAVKMGGMGIALAGTIGEEIAEMIQ